MCWDLISWQLTVACTIQHHCHPLPSVTTVIFRPVSSFGSLAACTGYSEIRFSIIQNNSKTTPTEKQVVLTKGKLKSKEKAQGFCLPIGIDFAIVGSMFALFHTGYRPQLLGRLLPCIDCRLRSGVRGFESRSEMLFSLSSVVRARIYGLPIW